ncbi:hypothetical protein [Asticcacaulis sp. AND118]|uniref:hypothetical protein n=1 Tax=Asticcacaulis sp. AND118 TaxID=2840468 RepID=UPI002103CB68|nr:hypothetical protein [Asticcacaulis sp. AND118]
MRFARDRCAAADPETMTACYPYPLANCRAAWMNALQPPGGDIIAHIRFHNIPKLQSILCGHSHKARLVQG